MSGPGQQQSNPGSEQLDPELKAEFEELLESITKSSVKKVLARNKEKLVRKAVVNEEALQGLTEEKLVAYGLYEADAAALKVAFPTPIAAGAGGAAGGSGAAGPSSLGAALSRGGGNVDAFLQALTQALLAHVERQSRSATPQSTGGAPTPDTGNASQPSNTLLTPASPPMQVSSAHAVDSGACTAPATGDGVTTPDPPPPADAKAPSV